jgi:hypothetical protein
VKETDMTDQEKPEDLKDDDLDAAQGGFIAFGTETSTLRDKAKRDGFMSAGGGMDPSLTDKDDGDGFISFGDGVGV